MHGREPQSDRPGIAEATLSRRSTVHRRHRGATRVRGPNDSSKTATQRIRVRPRGPIPRRRAESIGIDWSPATAYAVGLMATDGNLSGRKGHLSLISKDVDQIET